MKDSKKRLHDDQNNHNFRMAMARDKITEIKTQLAEKKESIRMKTTDIYDLKEELENVTDELVTVIREKNSKL